MIVRIQGEGQYNVPSSLLDQLNDLDNRLVVLVSDGDEEGFRKGLSEMLGLVRSQGSQLPVEEIHPSDVILPAPDIDLQEARSLFAEEGLIPG